MQLKQNKTQSPEIYSGLFKYGHQMPVATNCHVPRQPLQNHLSLRGPWRVGDIVLAEEMLDGHHQRLDIPAHARTAHKGHLQKRLEERISAESSLIPS